jgi:hypothetical protein
MSEIERVWDRVKDRAAALAERDVVLDSADSRMLVIQICREERAERPPPGAIEYLASELMRLTAESHRLLHSEL